MLNRSSAWCDAPGLFLAAQQAFAEVSSLGGPALRPEPSLVFRPFEVLAPSQVRCVVLGQDPYPTPGHAMGLSFSVPNGTRPLPPTLKNILKELESDLGETFVGSDLSGWVREGVLLANAALTMAGTPGEHARVWASFTKAWVARLVQENKPCVWILWGKDAAAIAPWITASNHRIIQSAHPSPLAAYRGFWGSNPFSRCNAQLASLGCPAINWLRGAG